MTQNGGGEARCRCCGMRKGTKHDQFCALVSVEHSIVVAGDTVEGAQERDTDDARKAEHNE